MPQPGIDDTPTFTFKHDDPEIILTVIPANMGRYRELKKGFDGQYPPPTPPIIRVVTFEAAMDPNGPGYEEMPDPDDEDYKKAAAIRNYLLFQVGVRFFQTTCIKINTQRDTLMVARLTKAGIAVQQAFAEFIVSISEITWPAVIKRMEELDYRWGDRPLHLIDTPSTPGRMSVKDALLQVAANTYMLTEREVDKLPISDQVDMLARSILWNKLQYLTEKKRAEEAEQRAKANRSRRGKR